DAAFSYGDETTFLVGVVYRGTEFIEDICVAPVAVDGDGSTESIVQLFQRCNNPRQIKAVLLDGISFAGFNLVDVPGLSERLEKPVIAVTASEPDREDFRETMERTGNYDEVFEKFEEAEEVELEDGSCYIQYAGTSREEAEQVVRNSTLHGQVPEPIRVAHMIGRADVHIEKEDG
ncbi:MAG: DUF99 family protein, partial [Candidatus Nanohaloarchaea archaeon]|nr:DUF99 family protein [Candidatus Nanohaloarchaea archaeon]